MDINQAFKDGAIAQLHHHESRILFHQAKIDFLRRVLLEFDIKDEATEKTKIIKVNEPKYEYDFPKDANRPEQAMWLLKNRVKKAMSLTDMQLLYDSVSDTPGDIKMAIRLLKPGVVKKDYGKNVVHWGLTEWFDEKTNDFKPEFKTYPNSDELLLIV